MMSSLRFVRSVKMNLAYLRRRSQDLREERLSQLDSERHNFHRAIQFGLGLPETRTETAELVLQLFPLIERRSYWHEWIPVLEQLLAKDWDANSSLKFELLKQLGELQRLNRKVQAALEIHQLALQVALELGDEEALTQAKINLSEDYRLLRQYDDAQRYALMVLEACTNQGARRWRAVVLNTLGLVAQSRGDLERSEHRLREAIRVWRELEQPTELARVLNNLALTLQKNGKFEQALDCYHEAATQLAPTVSELDKVKVQISLGTLYFDLKQWSRAEAAFKQANSHYLQHTSHFYYRALIAQNLGNVLLTQKRFSEAEDHLRYARTLWQEVDDNLMLANTLGTLSEAVAAQGQTKAGRHLLEQAMILVVPYLANDGFARLLLKELERVQLVLEEKEKKPGLFKTRCDNRRQGNSHN